jgi:hypothetical protein
MKLHRIAAVAGAAALLVPAGVFAKGKPEDPGSKGKGHSKAKTFVFKGTWNDTASTVAVTGGNSRVRKGGFKGTEVAFDFAAAKVNVADTNADGVLNADDFVDGDKLVVQAKLPRDSAGAGPFAARKAVDQTHPKVEDEVEAEPTPEATPEA